ncbi:hypothetical protein FOCC_FOCC001574 [Frankliniella occidentalis]|nr:hypothetical protein FOCC_FOCC001574 [Frankliniella occidentalis]
MLVPVAEPRRPAAHRAADAGVPSRGHAHPGVRVAGEAIKFIMVILSFFAAIAAVLRNL